MKQHLKLQGIDGRHTWIDLDQIAFAGVVDDEGKRFIDIIFKESGAKLRIPDTKHFTEPFEKHWGFE
jgi:hypothetical protein